MESSAADSSTAVAPERIVVKRGGAEVSFAAVNPITAWRARSIMEKEPGTVSWIEEFAPGEVMIDIGANVGLYALCAARFCDVRVYGFEPESQNYALLNRNIHDNGLGDKVTAYCCALSDETRFDVLYLSQFMAGGSCHNFGESVGPDMRPMNAAFRQGCFSTTLDELVARAVVPVPHHIKIDVDGIEHKVIRGAAHTLRDGKVRSVLVEINTNLEAHWDVIDTMLDCGFTYSQEEAEQAQRKEGAFKNVGNYVFRRPARGTAANNGGKR